MEGGSQRYLGITTVSAEYCVHGVFATLKAANAEARRARDSNGSLQISSGRRIRGTGGEKKGQRKRKKRKVQMKKRRKRMTKSLSCTIDTWVDFEADEGSLNVVVEKFDLQ